MIDSVSTPGRAARAEHLGYHAFAVMHGRGKADHFENHFVVGPRPLGAGIAHVDWLGKERAIDLNIGRAAGLEIGADELVGLAMDHLDDFAAWALTLACRPAVKLHQDHVARGGVAGPLLRDEDVLDRGAQLPPRLFGATGGAASGRTKPNPFAARWKTPATRCGSGGRGAADFFGPRAAWPSFAVLAADAFGLPAAGRIRCLGRTRFARGESVA